MYRDYKKGESLDNDLVGGNGILWMFSGVILGLLAGLAMYYVANRDTSTFSTTERIQDRILQAQKQATGPNKPAINKPSFSMEIKEQPVRAKKERVHYDYYGLLPNLEVPVDENPPALVKTAQTAQIASQASPQKTSIQITRTEQPQEAKIGDFLLQIASFKKEQAANKTRGRLSQKGLEAYVEPRQVRGRTWYRVYAGPVDGERLENWKHTAEKLGHRPMVISVR